jgi:hypothetical protein
MATTKRSKGGRAAATRATSSARGRNAKSAKVTATKATAKPKTKASGKAKAVAKPKPGVTKRAIPTRAATAAKRPATAPATKGAAPSAEISALKAKFQRERNGLERRLTDAVREIGLLRHHELRAMQLERQLAERDATIVRLQTQLVEIERRPAEPVYVQEVQQTLALGVATTHDLEPSEPDLDEFEDDRLADDADLVSEDD